MEKTPLLPLPSPEERVKLRKLMGLSYAKAALEIGVSTQTLWRWEHGQDQNILPDNHRKYQVCLHRWKKIIDNFPV